MAATQAGALLTEAHRLAQVQLSAQTVARLLQLWPLLDPEDIDGTIGRWLNASLPVIRQQRAASERIAAAYLERFRAIEVPDADPITFPPAPPLADDAATTSLLVRGPYRLRGLLGQAVSLAEASSTASADAAAAGTRHALNGGREFLQEAAAADPLAVGARRVTSPGCCAFCALLAARSYDGLSSDATRTGMDAYKVHDNCHCTSEIVYPNGAQIVERQTREFAALYARSRDDFDAGAGTKNPALTAFRRALEAQRQGA